MLLDHRHYPEHKIIATCHAGVYQGAELQDVALRIFGEEAPEINFVIIDLTRVTEITDEDSDLAKLYFTARELGWERWPEIIAIADQMMPGFASRRDLVFARIDLELKIVESWDAALSQISEDLKLPYPFQR